MRGYGSDANGTLNERCIDSKGVRRVKQRERVKEGIGGVKARADRRGNEREHGGVKAARGDS